MSQSIPLSSTDEIAIYGGICAPVLTLIAFYAAFNDRNLSVVVGSSRDVPDHQVS